MTTLVPASGSPFKSISKFDERRNLYQTEAVLPTETVAPGQTVTVETQLFVGGKRMGHHPRLRSAGRLWVFEQY